MPTKTRTDIIEAYVAAFTTLDVDNMDTLLRLVDDDVHFVHVVYFVHFDHFDQFD